MKKPGHYVIRWPGERNADFPFRGGSASFSLEGQKGTRLKSLFDDIEQEQYLPDHVIRLDATKSQERAMIAEWKSEYRKEDGSPARTSARTARRSCPGSSHGACLSAKVGGGQQLGVESGGHPLPRSCRRRWILEWRPSCQVLLDRGVYSRECAPWPTAIRPGRADVPARRTYPAIGPDRRSVGRLQIRSSRTCTRKRSRLRPAAAPENDATCLPGLAEAIHQRDQWSLSSCSSSWRASAWSGLIRRVSRKCSAAASVRPRRAWATPML